MNARAWALVLLGICCALPAGTAAARDSLGAIDSLASPSKGYDTRGGEPSLSVAPDGTVWMSWFEWSNAKMSINSFDQPAPARTKTPPPGSGLMTSRLVGGKWLAPVQANTNEAPFRNWADTPVLIALGGTVAAIAYPARRPGIFAYDLRLSFTSSGGVLWTKPITVNRDGKPVQHGFASLVPSGDGVDVIWLDGRKTRPPRPGHEATGDMSLRAVHVSPEGALANEVEIDPRVCECCGTAAVATSRGVLVAYRDRERGEVRDIAVTRFEGGRWSRPAPLHRDGWKIAGCPVNGPALDAKGDRVAAAWFTMQGEQPAVLVAFSADGGRSFGAPIAAGVSDPLGRVDVALLPDGSALVSWLDALGQDALLRVQRLSAAGARDEPVTVARTSASRSSGFPKMAIAQGRAIFAWVDASGRLRTASARIP